MIFAFFFSVFYFTKLSVAQGRIVDELESIWKEAVLAFSGGTEENLTQDSRPAEI
jgi:hypothetical protein